MKKFTKETMSVREFMSGRKEETAWAEKVARHFEKYGMVYKIAGSTVVILMAGGGFDYAFAASAMTPTALDREFYGIYREIIRFGKWLIVIKGGLDIIKSVGNGDFESAKKHGISYVLIYILLLALPFGMQKVDAIFSRLSNI